MTNDKAFSFRDFLVFRLDCLHGRGGGLLTLVSRNFCRKVAVCFEVVAPDCGLLDTTLELPRRPAVYLVNAYFPAGVGRTNVLDAAKVASSNSLLIRGDFNIHHVCWGFRTDACGRRFHSWAIDENFLFANSNSITYMRGGACSIFDLTFSFTGLVLSPWSTVDSGSSSDHISIAFDVCVAVCPVPFREKRFSYFEKFQEIFCSLLVSLSRLGELERDQKIVASLASAKDKYKFLVKCSPLSKGSPWWTLVALVVVPIVDGRQPGNLCYIISAPKIGARTSSLMQRLGEQ